jgi:hypothetical protein
MPQEVRQEMKDVHNDVEEVPYDQKDDHDRNGQDSQLKELVNRNTR